MINGYGIFLCVWFFAVFVGTIIRLNKSGNNLTANILGAAIKCAAMTWLVFQI